MAIEPIRVRFAPSPTGYLHIGGARTLLFNWLLARQTGGAVVLRIEDTDRSRQVDDSLPKILDDIRWLRLDWNEGPEVGGDYGPYFQSERLDLYQQYLDQLLERGDAYYALETPGQLAAMREQAKSKGTGFRYVRPDPLPSVEQGRQARGEGKPVTVRFKVPAREVVVSDQILGEIRIAADDLEDFIIQKSDGWPTYHFACVVDDELMGITHVLRGQEHLTNTPKHVLMQDALGFRRPVYAHLPVIFNIDGTKMSKRDKEKARAKGLPPPEIDVHDFRAAGYLPEALVNFISLLGWSTGDDNEQLTLDETVRRFSISRVGATNARFDRDKLLAFNTDWAARLDRDRLVEALRDFVTVSGSPLQQLDDQTLGHLLGCAPGFKTFRDIERKSLFLVVEDDKIVYDPQAVKKVLAKNGSAGFERLQALQPQLESLSPWSVASLEKLIAGICEDEGLKLGAVAQPLRVAVTGSTVSPPIYDTLALLGKERTLNRVERTLALRSDF